MHAISLIVSAYNNLSALARALPFYQCQTYSDFELIVADDGSSKEQVDSFRQYAASFNVNMKHVWHEDDGFNKCGILNKAILAADSERLFFTDADMIPRQDLVESHFRLLKHGIFISGGSHINLSPDGQSYVEELEVKSLGSIFSNSVLVKPGYVEANKARRLSTFGLRAKFMDLITYRANAFSGANASCWKADAVAVNGFDESWGYGGLDRDFGIRLANSGVRGRRYQYQLVMLHQDHKRPYKNKEQVRLNKLKLKERARAGTTYVEKGISQYQDNDVQIAWQQVKN